MTRRNATLSLRGAVCLPRIWVEIRFVLRLPDLVNGHALVVTHAPMAPSHQLRVLLASDIPYMHTFPAIRRSSACRSCQRMPDFRKHSAVHCASADKLDDGAKMASGPYHQKVSRARRSISRTRSPCRTARKRSAWLTYRRSRRNYFPEPLEEQKKPFRSAPPISRGTPRLRSRGGRETPPAANIRRGCQYFRIGRWRRQITASALSMVTQIAAVPVFDFGSVAKVRAPGVVLRVRCSGHLAAGSHASQSSVRPVDRIAKQRATFDCRRLATRCASDRKHPELHDPAATSAAVKSCTVMPSSEPRLSSTTHVDTDGLQPTQ